jgi:hypothetical protein
MYKISIQHDGLGDVLTYTAICRHLQDSLIYLKNEKYKFLFNNLCKEIIVGINNDYILNGIGVGHYTKQKLRLFNIETDDILPKIYINEEKVLLYKNILAKYDNPIIFVSNCSIAWKHLREFKDTNLVQKYLNKLSKEHTILHFGVSNNFTKFKNTIDYVDLPLEDIAVYYSIVKKYIGIDTGDYHLMLAVGGNAEVYVPNQTNDYMYENWHYPNKNRVIYKNFVSLQKEINND